MSPAAGVGELKFEYDPGDHYLKNCRKVGCRRWLLIDPTSKMSGQAERLRALLAAKNDFDVSEAAIKELESSGVLTAAQAQQVHRS